MNRTLILAILGLFLMTNAQAGIGSSSSSSLLNSKERCAAALNSYLNYRHENEAEDATRIQKLENQVDALCQGYQVQLMENGGVTTGVLELSE